MSDPPCGPKPPQITPAALSTHAAAEYLGLGENAFRAHVKPHVPHAKVGARELYRVVDLDAWLARQVASDPERNVFVPPVRRRKAVPSKDPLVKQIEERLLKRPRNSTRREI